MSKTTINKGQSSLSEEKFQTALQKIKGLRKLSIDEIILLTERSGYATNKENLLNRDDINVLIKHLEKLLYKANPSKKLVRHFKTSNIRFDMIHPSILNLLYQVLGDNFTFNTLYKTTNYVNNEYPEITLECIDFYKNFIKNHIELFIFNMYNSTHNGGWYMYNTAFSRSNQYFICKLLVYYLLTNQIKNIRTSEVMISRILLYCDGNEVSRALKEIQNEREDLFNSEQPIENNFELIEYMCSHDYFNPDIKREMIEKKISLKTDIRMDMILNNCPQVLCNWDTFDKLSHNILYVDRNNIDSMTTSVDKIIYDKNIVQLVRLMILSKLNDSTFNNKRDTEEFISLYSFMKEYLNANKSKMFEIFIEYFLKERLSIPNDRFMYKDMDDKYDRLVAYNIGYVFNSISNNCKNYMGDVLDALLFVKNTTIVTEEMEKYLDYGSSTRFNRGLYNGYFDIVNVMTFYGVTGAIYEYNSEVYIPDRTEVFRNTVKEFYVKLLSNEKGYLLETNIDELLFIIKHSNRDLVRMPFFFHINKEMIDLELNEKIYHKANYIFSEIFDRDIKSDDNPDRLFNNIMSNMVITCELMNTIMTDEKETYRNLMKEYLYMDNDKSSRNKIVLTSSGMKAFINANQCTTYLRNKYTISLATGLFNFIDYLTKVEPFYKAIDKKITIDGYDISDSIESLNGSIYLFKKYEIDENGEEKVIEEFTRDSINKYNIMRRLTDLDKDSYYSTLNNVEKIIIKDIVSLISNKDSYVILNSSVDAEPIFKLYHTVFDDTIFINPTLSKNRNGFSFNSFKYNDNPYSVDRPLRELITIYVSMVKNNNPLGRNLLRDLMLRILTAGRYTINKYNEIKRISDNGACNKNSTVILPKNMSEFNKVIITTYNKNEEDINLKDIYDMCDFLSTVKEEIESVWNSYNFYEPAKA